MFLMSEGWVEKRHTSVHVRALSRGDLKATHLAANSNSLWVMKIGMFAIFFFWLLRFFSSLTGTYFFTISTHDFPLRTMTSKPHPGDSESVLCIPGDLALSKEKDNEGGARGQAGPRGV